MHVPLSMTPTISPPAQTGSRRRAFTCDEYSKLTDIGFFGSDRVELIGGEILVKPPMTNLHAKGIDQLADALKAVFGPSYWVRAQMTLDLTPLSVPDPDIAVVTGNRAAYPGRQNPTTAVLVAEVSDASLAEDRNRKGSLYAAAGIQEYWILNIPDQQLEVRRDPRPDSTEEFGHGYGSLTTLRAGDSVSPLAMPAATIRIDDLLPQ